MPGRRLRGGYRCGCGHSECLPVGYLIIAFPGDSEATSAREALLTGADEDDEVVTFDRGAGHVGHREQPRHHLAVRIPRCRTRPPGSNSSRREAGGELPRRPRPDGTGDEARHGCRRFGARLAHKYNRLTVEEIL
jgi:hypothetical protein